MSLPDRRYGDRGSTLGKPNRLELPPGARDCGYIVTAAHENGPPLYTFHVSGPSLAALREACQIIDGLDDGWYVQSVSTPRTIYRDLQGTRQDHSKRPRVANFSGASKVRFPDDPRSAEIKMMGQVGRLDLLRPLPTFPAASSR